MIFRRSTCSFFKCPALYKAFVQGRKVDSGGFPLYTAKRTDILCIRGTLFQFLQSPRGRDMLSGEKSPGIPDLAADNGTGNLEGPDACTVILAAANLGDGIVYRDKASLVPSVICEVVHGHAPLPTLRENRRGDRYAPEDVDRPHLFYWE